MCTYIYIYIYIYIHACWKPLVITVSVFTCLLQSFCSPVLPLLASPGRGCWGGRAACTGRGDDTVGSPHRAQICQFELFERILLLKLDKRFPVEHFEATAPQSTVPSPLIVSDAGVGICFGSSSGNCYSALYEYMTLARKTSALREAVLLFFNPRSVV